MSEQIILILILILIFIILILLLVNRNKSEEGTKNKLQENNTIYPTSIEDSVTPNEFIYLDEEALKSLYYLSEAKKLVSLTRDFKATVSGSVPKIIEGEINTSVIEQFKVEIPNILQSEVVLNYLEKEGKIIVYKEPKKYINDELEKFNTLINELEAYEYIVISEDQKNKQREKISQSKDVVSFLYDKKEGDIKNCFFQNIDLVISSILFDDKGQIIGNIKLQNLVQNNDLDVDLIIFLDSKKLRTRGKNIMTGKNVEMDNLNVLGTIDYTKKGTKKTITITPHLIF